eukprot:gene11816-24758_t
MFKELNGDSQDILRAARKFVWTNKEGQKWSDILQSSARKEFEQGRFETDPIIATRMVLVGRDCLNQTAEKFNKVAASMTDHIDKTRT